MKSALRAWLPFAVVVTCVTGVAFFAAHHALRQAANDPQIQLAEDWTDQINGGTDANRLNLGPFIDPARSLAPFGIVYDQSGNIIASSVAAPSSMKQPDGVFDAVDAAPTKEARYTWRPASGERYAAVLRRVTFEDKTYYVLAGRNLRETDARIERVEWIVLAGWAAALVGVAVAQNVQLIGRMTRRK